MIIIAINNNNNNSGNNKWFIEEGTDIRQKYWEMGEGVCLGEKAYQMLRESRQTTGLIKKNKKQAPSDSKYSTFM